MKKITLLCFTLFSFIGFAQQKSTGTISLSNNVPITANFTLDNSTSQVTLILTGPSDRWFGIGLGVVSGFGMDSGDALVFTTSTTPNLTDRTFVGTVNPQIDANQSWTIVSNTTNGSVRTLVLNRALTNSEPNDFQFPYASTNSISFGGARAPSANMTVGSHGGSASAGYAINVPFTTLGVEDFSLNASKIFPNPTNGDFSIQTKTYLNQVNIYTQTGAFVKTIYTENNEEVVNVEVNGLSTGIYLIELINDNQKTWKKVIVN